MDEPTCATCGSAMPPRKTQPGRPRKYCSARCGSIARRDNTAKTCGEPDCDRPVRAKGLCYMHYRRTRPRPKDRMTETRRAALRRKTQRRRALTFDPNADLIDRDEIGDRDGWRCGLCARRVDSSLAWPHPRSASLDHIEPLSLGGRHVKENVQIAHLSCNVAKGNRGGGEQLLLLG